MTIEERCFSIRVRPDKDGTWEVFEKLKYGNGEIVRVVHMGFDTYEEALKALEHVGICPPPK